MMEKIGKLFSAKGKKKGAEAKKDGLEIRPGFAFSLEDWRTASAIAIGVAFALVWINFMLFQQEHQIFAIINGVAGVIALGIPITVRYRQYTKTKNIESAFPAFMADVTENINVGMSLPRAVKTASAGNYGILTPYIKGMSAKLDWGIPFDTVLKNFAEQAHSPVIARAVKGIIEAHRSGGTIGTVLKAMTVSVRELERIKKERAARVYSQMVTGYFIYLLFLGIMLAMSRILIPALTSQIQSASMENISQIYADTFRAMVVIQGIFAGLGIGKMSEGSITAGFKHSFVLAVLGYTAFLIF